MHRYVVCVRDNWFVIGGQMAREPNAEQQKAIEHTGGVSLSAGAGSGKTFVLVEHIYSLTMKKLLRVHWLSTSYLYWSASQPLVHIRLRYPC